MGKRNSKFDINIHIITTCSCTIIDSDNDNKNIEKEKIDNEYLEHEDEEWKPEIIEIIDSDDDTKEIENFLDKVKKGTQSGKSRYK